MCVFKEMCVFLVSNCPTLMFWCVSRKRIKCDYLFSPKHVFAFLISPIGTVEYACQVG